MISTIVVSTISARAVHERLDGFEAFERRAENLQRFYAALDPVHDSAAKHGDDDLGDEVADGFVGNYN